MMETETLHAPSAEQSTENDLVLSPRVDAPSDAHVEKKMAAVVYDRSHAEFEMPSGRTLYIYGKSEGQLREIDLAFHEWLDVERKSERKIKKRWRFWRVRRARALAALTDIQQAKYAFFCRVFEDLYNEHKHQELTADEFLQMPLDLQTAILSAHREANDPTDLLGAILGQDLADSKKKLTPPRDGIPS